MQMISAEDPLAVELRLATLGGDVAEVKRLLSERPELATASFGSVESGTGTGLHFVAGWPGYYPHGPEIVHALVDAGADPNTRTTSRGSAIPGPGSESPLHYAASNDDVDVAAALIDRGADVEAPDGSIGTPLDNAIGYTCWHVARLVAARGALVDKAWHAAALGMLGRLAEVLGGDPPAEDVSQAF